MSKITVNSNKASRSVKVESPAVLDAETLDALVAIMGEDKVLKSAQSQLLISFRGMVRGKLEAGNIEEGEFTYSDEDIMNEDYTDWIPEGRVVKSPEDKLKSVLDGMDLEDALRIIEEQRNKG